MFIGTNKIKYISRQDALDELSKLDLCDVEIRDQEEKYSSRLSNLKMINQNTLIFV